MTYRTKPSLPEEHLVCVLCDRTRAQVRQLIAGRSGAVCSDCVQQCVEVLQERPFEPMDAAAEVLERSLAALPSSAPFATSGALVRAALEVAADADACRRIARHAERVQNGDAAVEALTWVPEEARTNGDWVAIAAACVAAQRHREGLAALERIAGDDPNDRVLVTINRAALFLDRANDGGAAVDEVALARDLRRARELLLASFPAGDARHAAYLPPLDTNLAELAVRGRRFAEATSMLTQLEKTYGSLSPAPRAILGDAYAGLGDRRRAREAWERALAATHPESALAARLRRCLDGEPPPVPGAARPR